MNEVKISPELNDAEVAVLRTAPHGLTGWSNVGAGHGRMVYNLERFGYLEKTHTLMGRELSGADAVTCYSLSQKGKGYLSGRALEREEKSPLAPLSGQ